MADAARKRALADFYEKFTQPPLPTDAKIENILAKYSSDEKLYKDLCDKYNVNVNEVDDRRRKIQRLEDFYAKYAADSMHKINSVMLKSDDFEGLLDALRKKYKVTPEEFPNVAAPPPSTITSKSSQPQEIAPVTPLPTSQTPPQAASDMPLEQFQNRSVMVGAQLKVREQAMAVREAAIKALEAAVQAKTDSLALVAPERAAPWTRPSDVTLDVNNNFLSHLAGIEQRLLKKSFELSTLEASLRERQDAVTNSENKLQAQEQRLEEEFSEFVTTRNADATHRAALEAKLEEQKRFCERQIPLLEAKEKALLTREEEVDAKLRSFSSREALLVSNEVSLASQLKAASEERELAKRLSEEVLKREATVRVVEKALNQARTELTRLEEDLGARTRKLLVDESSVRTWAGEVERKEAKLFAILEQLKQKGVVVSGL